VLPLLGRALQVMQWTTHVSAIADLAGGERAWGWIGPDGRGLDGRASLFNPGCGMAPLAMALASVAAQSTDAILCLACRRVNTYT
jgi:hypothetical protein